jgi:hypothetical protein
MTKGWHFNTVTLNTVINTTSVKLRISGLPAPSSIMIAVGPRSILLTAFLEKIAT